MVNDMGKNSFAFKEFMIHQDRCAMKVTTDACVFGAWVVSKIIDPKRILDIGAGTGLLSLMLAQKTPAFIDAVEVEDQAFLQMKENIENSRFNKNIRPLHADIKYHQINELYDLIISNPPFHQEQLMAESKEINLARHQEGLIFSDLLMIAKKSVLEKGSVFILMPYYREKECCNLVAQLGGTMKRIARVSHSCLHSPFRVMFEIVFEHTNTIEEEIIIHQKDGRYTETFTQLLRPYYLYL
jgi:tRNA1Val (adenine37-N6)-methyltransferase